MNSWRDTFLRKVREAVAEGNRAGGAPALPPRGTVGYQGAGPDPVARFVREFAAAGGHALVVPDRQAARSAVLDIVRARAPRSVLVGRCPLLDGLDLGGPLRAAGVEVIPADGLDAAGARGAFFRADVGVSGVDFLIAETGTMVLAGTAARPRSLSLLPPVHVAVATRSQVLADLFDLFEGDRWGEGLPAGLSLITGPSKTGDIELRLVTGVHGPGEVHAVVVAGEGA
jgi:L-lactate utilization protein LutC